MNKSPTWAHVKARIDTIDRVGLIGIIRDLYDAAGVNRRFLHARFVPTRPTLDEYRRLVRAAVFPDPFSQRPIRLRDATATISEYKRATGDVGGTIDLMLEFVEAGTEQAADLGYGDEPYFSALERKVTEIVRALDTLSDTERNVATARLIRLGEYEGAVGWGYGDFLADVAAKLQHRNTNPRADRSRAGRGV